MKNLIFIFLISLFNKVAGQPPQAIPYQAVARDNAGNLINNQTISLRFSIHDATPTGMVIYAETQNKLTNSLGLFTANIGQGTVISGIFVSIDWGIGSKFMQIEMDVTGGNTYIDMGTQQMLSVPYALNAGSITRTYSIGLNPDLGGYVFWVSSDGKHGLVAETQDQILTNWWRVQDAISDPANHSTNGSKFRDWRLPTKYELNEMYIQKLAIGGFDMFASYWCSTEESELNAYHQNMGDGDNTQANNKGSYAFKVRAIRAF